MLISTVGLLILAWNKWSKYRFVLIPIFVGFLLMDLSLFAASSTKLLTGAWIPLIAGFCLGSMMWIWRKGRQQLNIRLNESSMTWAEVEKLRKKGKIAITQNLGIYPSSIENVVPQALEQQIRVMGSMPKNVVVVTVTSVDRPFSHMPPEYKTVNEFVSTVNISSGFMEQRNVPRALRSKSITPHMDEREAIYFVTDRTLIPAHRTNLNRAEEVIFTTLHRNATAPAHFYHLPERRVITFDVSIEV
jgi:KUP system potassium uptake protein